MRNLKVFLPQISTEELAAYGLTASSSQTIQVQPLASDWQTMFCRYVGMKQNDLPWTQLRMAQFQLNSTIKTACCCDPVLMQLTHRGAYMLGQAPLNLTSNDALRIVTQVNERLMKKGEHLYLIDKHTWLFTSEESLTLSSLAIKDLVGKDIFNYPYRGVHAKFWQQRQTEIQMLIKEMTDYQGLPATSSDTIMDVHFSDLVNADTKPEIPFIKNESLTILSDNELVKTFCMNSLLTSQSANATDLIEKKDVCMIAFDSERDSYQSIVDFWKSQSMSGRLKSSQLICQDSQLEYKSSTGFLKRLFGP